MASSSRALSTKAQFVLKTSKAIVTPSIKFKGFINLQSMHAGFIDSYNQLVSFCDSLLLAVMCKTISLTG